MAQARLERFRMLLLREAPFWGDILLHVPLAEDKSVTGAATDGRRILLGPGILGSMEEPQLNWTLMHELFHMLLMHPFRRGGRDPRLWMVAADLMANSLCRDLADTLRLRRSELSMEPPPGTIAAMLAPGESTESLYDKLLADNPDAAGTVEVRQNYRFGHAATHAVEVPADVIEDPEAEAVALQQIRGLIRGADQRARGTGAPSAAPPPILALVQSRRLPWRTLLREFLEEQQDDETSWATPERKYLHMDMILPGHGLGEGALTELWAFVDSSGSIGADTLRSFLTQLCRVSKEFRCTMHIAYWNTRVTEVYRNIRSEKAVLECRPGHQGGTDINCVYRWLRESHTRPDCMVILTDGCFGPLTEDPGRLRDRTILVLSTDLAVTDDMKRIGRTASLQSS